MKIQFRNTPRVNKEPEKTQNILVLKHKNFVYLETSKKCTEKTVKKNVPPLHQIIKKKRKTSTGSGYRKI